MTIVIEYEVGEKAEAHVVTIDNSRAKADEFAEDDLRHPSKRTEVQGVGVMYEFTRSIEEFVESMEAR